MTALESLLTRIDALEMRVAHQDRAIEDLNNTITAQWKEIESLTRQIERVGDQVQEIAAGPAEPEPPPPHY
jgi:SlyX protein